MWNFHYYRLLTLLSTMNLLSIMDPSTDQLWFINRSIMDSRSSIEPINGSIVDLLWIHNKKASNGKAYGILQKHNVHNMCDTWIHMPMQNTEQDANGNTWYGCKWIHRFIWQNILINGSLIDPYWITDQLLKMISVPSTYKGDWMDLVQAWSSEAWSSKYHMDPLFLITDPIIDP